MLFKEKFFDLIFWYNEIWEKAFPKLPSTLLSNILKLGTIKSMSISLY